MTVFQGKPTLKPHLKPIIQSGAILLLLDFVILQTSNHQHLTQLIFSGLLTGLWLGFKVHPQSNDTDYRSWYCLYLMVLNWLGLWAYFYCFDPALIGSYSAFVWFTKVNAYTAIGLVLAIYTGTWLYHRMMKSYP